MAANTKRNAKAAARRPAKATAEPKAALRKWLKALTSGDVETLLALQTPDCEWHLPGPPELLPWAGEFKGEAAARRALAGLYGAITLHKQEPKEFIIQGNRVVVIGNEVASSKPKGKKWDVAFAWAFTVKRGKVSHWVAYENTEAIAACYR